MKTCGNCRKFIQADKEDMNPDAGVTEGFCIANLPICIDDMIDPQVSPSTWAERKAKECDSYKRSKYS